MTVVELELELRGLEFDSYLELRIFSELSGVRILLLPNSIHGVPLKHTWVIIVIKTLFLCLMETSLS